VTSATENVVAFATTLHDVFYILRQRLEEPGLTFESKGAEVIDIGRELAVAMLDQLEKPTQEG